MATPDPQVSPAACVVQAEPSVLQNAVLPQVTSAQPVAQQILNVPLLTHSPLAQSAFAEQVWPFAFLHVPLDAQANPAAHCVSVEQEVAQEFAPQILGEHCTLVGGMQLPEPSQVLLPPFWVPPVHDMLTLQVVPAVASWQPPVPLHLPVSPQVAVTGQKLGSRGAPPDAVGVHVPGVAVQV